MDKVEIYLRLVVEQPLLLLPVVFCIIALLIVPKEKRLFLTLVILVPWLTIARSPDLGPISIAAKLSSGGCLFSHCLICPGASRSKEAYSWGCLDICDCCSCLDFLCTYCTRKNASDHSSNAMAHRNSSRSIDCKNDCLLLRHEKSGVRTDFRLCHCTSYSNFKPHSFSWRIISSWCWEISTLGREFKPNRHVICACYSTIRLPRYDISQTVITPIFYCVINADNRNGTAYSK